MKFVDEAIITVRAGNGGNGVVSFRREKFVPRGGPDGGDGGRGGSVYLVGSEGLGTLVDFRARTLFRAPNGRGGAGANRTGASGVDVEIAVPTGTLVHDLDTGLLLGEIVAHGERLLVARGGDGGFGNTHYKSSVDRAPRRSTLGRAGEERRLRLELRLLADVGLLGFPNAGKSSLLARLSHAHPKIADYPFTTLTPQLGVAEDGERRWVAADVPGLVRGAAEGAGLGLRFLNHLRRTRLLLHVVDVGRADEETMLERVRTIVSEIEAFDPELAAKPRWLVANKIDLLSPEETAKRTARLAAASPDHPRLFAVSALDGRGVTELVRAVSEGLAALPRHPPVPAETRADD
jgi:GTP-binding protein